MVQSKERSKAGFKSLSPYLFVFCVEKLGTLIREAVEARQWKPVATSREGPKVSHLMFADDLILFGEASEQQISVVQSTLEKYCRMSGQKVNMRKSRIYFSNNVSGQHARSLARRAGLSITTNLGRYLGAPILHTRPRIRDYTFLVERVRQKLQGWKRKSLSLAGRVALIKSSSAAIPTYVMQTSKLPSGICDKIDQLNRKFLWGGSEEERKMHLVAWDRVCRDKHEGGLGLRNKKWTNFALLGKLWWHLLTDGTKLWVQVLRDKYVNRRRARPRSSTSHTWRSIQTAMAWFDHCISWRLGDGKRVLFWTDCWCMADTMREHTNNSPSGEDLMRTVQSYWSERDGWKWNEIRGLGEEARAILANIDLNRTSHLEDMPRWNLTTAGTYTCKSAYNFLVTKDTPTNLVDKSRKDYGI